jgi:hypothetical protein
MRSKDEPTTTVMSPKASSRSPGGGSALLSAGASSPAATESRKADMDSRVSDALGMTYLRGARPSGTQATASAGVSSALMPK